MSLKTFHLVFISLAALMLFGVAGWCLLTLPGGEQSLRIAGGALSCFGGAGLIVYGVRFVKRFRHVSYL